MSSARINPMSHNENAAYPSEFLNGADEKRLVHALTLDVRSIWTRKQKSIPIQSNDSIQSIKSQNTQAMVELFLSILNRWIYLLITLSVGGVAGGWPVPSSGRGGHQDEATRPRL